jgi:hypothetical protein
MSALRRDTGSLVLGWLVKIAAALALFAVIAFDAISIGAAHVTGQDDADGAAFAAADNWRDTHNAQQAFDAAQEAADAKNETVLANGFSIDRDGTVRLLLRRTATTLVAFRVGPLKKYTVVVIKGESGPPA